METREHAEHYYGLGEIVLRISWPEAFAADGHAVLDYHGFERRSREDDVDLSVDFAAPEVCHGVPTGALELLEHESGIRIFQGDGCFFVSRGATVVRVDAPDGRAVFYRRADAERADHSLAELYLFLTFALILLLQAREQYVLHAAALSSPRGAGVLLPAASGSGKSTVALALVRAGWHYVTDDSTLLAADEEGRIMARPFRRDFGLTRDTVRSFPELRQCRPRHRINDDKWRVDIDTLYPGRRIDRCFPRVIVFPEISRGAVSEITPMTQTEVAARLLGQSTFVNADPQASSMHLRVVCDLAQQAVGYRLQAGRDLKDDPDCIGALLHEVDYSGGNEQEGRLPRPHAR